MFSPCLVYTCYSEFSDRCGFNHKGSSSARCHISGSCARGESRFLPPFLGSRMAVELPTKAHVCPDSLLLNLSH